jgi:galactose mutarotase-like enzyme
VSLQAGDVEWLLPPAAEEPGGEAFVAAGLSGWDECLPTIDPCVVDGVALPDHGSVWSRPWHPVGDGWLGVDVDTPPLTFRRRLTATSDGLRLDYRLRSRADRRTPVLWATHPQLLAPQGTEVTVDPSRPAVVEVQPRREVQVDWSEVAAMASVAAGAFRKVYLLPDERADSATVQRADGSWLRLAWDPALVPHLGVWFDAGAFARQPVVALEPGVGWYDALDRAAANGTALQLAPGAETGWWLEVTSGSG